MFRTLRTNFDRRELRRDRRYPSPRVTVTIADIDYPTIDWSLGGFHIAEGPAVAIGDRVSGVMRVDGSDASYEFNAEAVRADESQHGVGFHFVGLSPELVTALDRAALRRFAGRR
jgi:hypothetical protein